MFGWCGWLIFVIDMCNLCKLKLNLVLIDIVRNDGVIDYAYDV